MPVDAMTLAVSAMVTALIQGGVGTLIWLAVRRNVETVDRLKNRIETIEGEKLMALARRQELAETENKDGRRRLHEEITWVRTHFVHAKSCEKMMGDVARGMEGFVSATRDLGRIQAATEQNTSQINGVAERIAGLATDLARMEGRHEEKGPK